MKQNEVTTLGHLMGTVDGLHEPLTLKGEAWRADWQNRDEYLESGLMPWRNPGDDGATRKAFARARDVLVGAGLVAVGNGGKRAGLTAAGLNEARRLCGLPSLADALVGLDFIHAAPDAVRWTGGLVSEATLAGLPATFGQKVGESRLPGRVLVLVDALAPLMVAGLVTWRTCHFSGVYLYSLTDAGQVLAERRRKAGDARPGDWPRLAKRCRKIKTRCPAASDAYVDAWESARQARQTAKPPRPNVVQHTDPTDPPKGWEG
ncbi:MAG: hypothetical protein RBT03_05405 [Kiritimatiellia bacterium]|jgi:hypothetical protein|nr:hypothetical protein [Kiritimatiellia bacterium]